MNTNPSNTNSSKKRGSAKKEGVRSDDTRKRREEKAAHVIGQKKERDLGIKRGTICPAADELYKQYGVAKAMGTDAVATWRTELIQAYQGCKNSNIFVTCNPKVDGDLVNILAELKVEEKQLQLGGGKMVGGYFTNPINQLIALNSWIAKKEDWTSCTKWLLTLIWEKCCKIYGYLYDGIGDAIGIIKDVGFTALGHTDTETFKFTAKAFSYLIDAGYQAIETRALQAHPYFRAIENHFKNILDENKDAIAAKIPDVVTPQHFQEWLNNTSMFNKIYWTLVTLKSYQATPLALGILSTAGSIIMSASYYGVLIAYYITSNNYFTFALLTSAAGQSVYESLEPEHKNLVINTFNRIDKFIADKALGPEVSPLTSMMDEIRNLPEEAKKFALEQAKLQNELTKSILTNAETNAALGKILQTEEIKAKIADVEKATNLILEQIESKKKRTADETNDEINDETNDASNDDLGDSGFATDATLTPVTPGSGFAPGGKRRTRKRGKRHSKRVPRKTKTTRKKRRGKK